jgi:restriction system protein
MPQDEADEVAPRFGADWNGYLNEWIEAVRAESINPRVDSQSQVETWSFPTDELRDEYFRSIETRDEKEIRILLLHFLFDPSTFGADHRNLQSLARLDKNERLDLIRTSEYHRRLLRVAGKKSVAHPGVRWVLDILPDSPRRAITVIEAYLSAHFWYLPDGRISGLFDAIALIRAAYVERDPRQGLGALMNISPREFEIPGKLVSPPGL